MDLETLSAIVTVLGCFITMRGAYLIYHNPKSAMSSDTSEHNAAAGTEPTHNKSEMGLTLTISGIVLTFFGVAIELLEIS